MLHILMILIFFHIQITNFKNSATMFISYFQVVVILREIQLLNEIILSFSLLNVLKQCIYLNATTLFQI